MYKKSAAILAGAILISLAGPALAAPTYVWCEMQDFQNRQHYYSGIFISDAYIVGIENAFTNFVRSQYSNTAGVARCISSNESESDVNAERDRSTARDRLSSMQVKLTNWSY